MIHSGGNLFWESIEFELLECFQNLYLYYVYIISTPLKFSFRATIPLLTFVLLFSNCEGNLVLQSSFVYKSKKNLTLSSSYHCNKKESSDILVKYVKQIIVIKLKWNYFSIILGKNYMVYGSSQYLQCDI